jgi:5'(3')-deoxyribonucleotidase
MPHPAPYVVFDLDDVLANLREHMMSMLIERTGRNIHWRQWQDYELSGLYRTSNEEIMHWVREDEVLEAATLEPHARDAVDAARTAGFRIAVITARAWHPRGDALTREWLRRHDLSVDELYLVPLFGDKAEVLNRLGVVEHFIDDHLAHLYPARELPGVRRVLLVDRPWNRSDETLQRLRDLSEFTALLQASA